MSAPRGALSDPRIVAAILSRTSRAHTLGPLTWKHAAGTSRHEGVVPVVLTGIDGYDEASLRIAASSMRPEKPRLAYHVADGWVRRLCVNSEHRPFPGTHKHQHEKIGAGECYEPDDIPRVPMTPREAVRVYREVFEAFATECNIVVGHDLAWTDPWEV